ASSERLIQVEQRARFAFDELECLGDDAHHLLRLVCDGLWSRVGDEVAATLRDGHSNVFREWVGRRFEDCATTEDVVRATSELLSRLRLARLQVVQHVPLEVRIAPLGEGLSGADAVVHLAIGMLERVVKARLGVELSATLSTSDGYRATFRMDKRVQK